MIRKQMTASLMGAVARMLSCCLLASLTMFVCPFSVQAEDGGEIEFVQAPCAHVEVGSGEQPSLVVAEGYVIEIPDACGVPVVRDLSAQSGVPGSYEVQFQYGPLAWNAFVVNPAADDVAGKNSVRIELPSAAGDVILDVSWSEFGGDRERSISEKEALELFVPLFRASTGNDGVLTFTQVPEGTRVSTPYYSLVVPKEDGKFDCAYSEGYGRTENQEFPTHVLEICFEDEGLADLTIVCHPDGALDGVHAIVFSGTTTCDDLGVFAAVDLNDSFREDFDGALDTARVRAVEYAASIVVAPLLAELSSETDGSSKEKGAE